jgi:hypothetical protein
MNPFRRGGTFRWLRVAAHPQAALQSRNELAQPGQNTYASSTTDQRSVAQERQENGHTLTTSNPAALPASVQTKNPTQETVWSRSWQNLQSRPWLVALLASGGIGLSALIWLFSVPPSPSCQQISPLAADSERLYCADQAARQGKLDQLVAALTVVKHWPQDHPLASQANQLTDKWSRSILAIAQQKMDQGHLKEAVSIARQVPQNSSVYPEAQTVVTAWESNWDQGQKIANNTQEALKQQEWRQASEQLQLLTELNNEYWRQQANQLARQIGAEKQAWEQLQEAQDLAQANTPEQLAQAIMLATQVNPQSYARDEAEVERERWSQALLKIAKEYLEAGDFQGTVTAAEKVPLDSSVHAEALELTQFGQAQTFAQKDTLWSYVGAWTLGQQIKPNRPLYESAQADVADWEVQIQNLAQLKLANWFANLDRVFTYQLAVDHAQLIQLDQPRRVQAQTLIAEWRKRIEILEDRPYILLATQLAAENTIQNLKQAIAEAGKIVMGRALRLEAQTLIAQWISRIQVIEDQPVLDQARALGDQGQLDAAIEVAQRISAGRALYGEAQGAIAEWVAQIQIAEDRPILDEATTLAAQGDLTAAITTASQISPDRALYAEAQEAISRWTAERDALQIPQQPELTDPDSSELSDDNDSFSSTPEDEDNAVDEEDADSDPSIETPEASSQENSE